MILKRLSWLRNLIGKSPAPFDPERFGDRIATLTEWTPVKKGGAGFRTHNLVMVDTLRVEFRASVGARLFYMLFLAIGMGIFAFACIHFARQPAGAALETAVPFLFGAVFAAMGAIMLRLGTVPIIFDKSRGFFWKGKQAPYETGFGNPPKYSAMLDDIHAIQLISEYCRGNKNSYYSYELNLVLRDGSRVNVIDHGNLAALRDQAGKLSEFLGKPVWDAIG